MPTAAHTAPISNASLAPLALAAEWDNVGLLLGDLRQRCATTD